jgi:hypothetical protein
MRLDLLNNIITQKLYELPANYWDTYPQNGDGKPMKTASGRAKINST